MRAEDTDQLLSQRKQKSVSPTKADAAVIVNEPPPPLPTSTTQQPAVERMRIGMSRNETARKPLAQLSAGRSRRHLLLLPWLLLVAAFAYNEYFIYWQVLYACRWSTISSGGDNQASQASPLPPPLKLMLLADTHLLGSRNGHWFDKLRREWQQHRAFQTARHLLRPDYVVILGDLTDEGKWCSDREWQYYEARVRDLFYTADRGRADANAAELIVVVGNHDVGFHYDMIARKLERFNRSYGGQFVAWQWARPRHVALHFVTVNSMSLENDRCSFCVRAQRELAAVNATLACLKQPAQCSASSSDSVSNSRSDAVSASAQLAPPEPLRYSRPILFTHFPLYRTNDRACPRDLDSEAVAAPFSDNAQQVFKPKYDCLSLPATRQLLEQIQPRLVFNGHTHYSCYNELHGVPEYTLASFSWRNIHRPSMLLLTLADEQHQVAKCFLPDENAVIALYVVSGALAAASLVFHVATSVWPYVQRVWVRLKERRVKIM